MQVFKFGGASVQDAAHIKNSISIIKKCKGANPLVVVVSAIGKTTNALEKVAEAFFLGQRENALKLFSTLKDFHVNMAQQLLDKYLDACKSQLVDLFTEVEWLLHDQPVREFGYYYDQIVCIGELLSTTIFSFAAKEGNCDNAWLDVRDVLRTDNSFREAIVDWTCTEEKIKSTIKTLNASTDIIVTQGFIGATDENESTTLGREGSDFTAAIFSNILEAKSLTIWKDVDGVMNADPKRFPKATPIRHLDYQEVIEMAYYGAQVIHPKTIKPLYSKQIALHVKCFQDTELQGTVIDGNAAMDLPPIFILKGNQLLVSLTTKDFSFVNGQPLIELFEVMQSLLIKPNMIQIGAIQVQLCLNNEPEKLQSLEKWAQEKFSIQYQKNLALTSVRHPKTETIKEFIPTIPNKVLEQKDGKVWQYLN
ncbi:MAG: aspartate kinase [Chitinophagaceae bacterium]